MASSGPAVSPQFMGSQKHMAPQEPTRAHGVAGAQGVAAANGSSERMGSAPGPQRGPLPLQLPRPPVPTPAATTHQLPPAARPSLVVAHCPPPLPSVGRAWAATPVALRRRPPSAQLGPRQPQAKTGAAVQLQGDSGEAMRIEIGAENADQLLQAQDQAEDLVSKVPGRRGVVGAGWGDGAVRMCHAESASDRNLIDPK